MKKTLLFLLFISVACNSDENVNPLLIGSWSQTAFTDQTGGWVAITPEYRPTLVFAKKGSISGIVGCGCLFAQSYKQDGNRLDLKFGGTPCPTLVTCQPEPVTEIVSLTPPELVLRRGQQQLRYERK